MSNNTTNIKGNNNTILQGIVNSGNIIIETIRKNNFSENLLSILYSLNFVFVFILFTIKLILFKNLFIHQNFLEIQQIIEIIFKFALTTLSCFLLLVVIKNKKSKEFTLIDKDEGKKLTRKKSERIELNYFKLPTFLLITLRYPSAV